MLSSGSLALSLLLLSFGLQEPGVTRSVPIRFEGLVLGPDGAPVEGAVVVTSEGGQAVTDPSGRYRLEVSVPLGAEDVRLTAVGPGGLSLVASSSVSLDATSAQVWGGILLLSSGTCSPGWLPTFGGRPGANDLVRAFSVFDDGSGPALYAGGSFTRMDGVVASSVARWDGSSWSAVGSGVPGPVHALTVFDDGSGPALYAGGSFPALDACLLKWNGTRWSAVGGELSNTPGDSAYIHALTVFDDGQGPALYAGGRFELAEGERVNHIARWNGSSWSPLLGGLHSGWETRALALLPFDDGTGPALYVGGQFDLCGGVSQFNIARWNGQSWSSLPTGGGYELGSFVQALSVFDDGSGPALYVGGAFSDLGGVPGTSDIARWNGSSWSPVGTGIDTGYVMALGVFDDGSGPALYAGGWIQSVSSIDVKSLAKWNGSSWSALGGQLDVNSGAESVLALSVFEFDGESALFVGGEFYSPGDEEASSLAVWNGTSWISTSRRINKPINTLAVFDTGTGPELYVGGEFTRAGRVVVNHIGRWDGSSWSSLGDGVSGFINSDVLALTVYDDGGGPALYAGGRFTTAGGVAASNLAKWNGSSWSALGSGLNGGVLALSVYDDGGGPALFAGGEFTTAGGVTVNYIARWNGSSWSALGGGMGNDVHALSVYDDGGGPALFAGGKFTTAGGVAAKRMARWDGSNWSNLGSGMNSQVRALSVFDDGGGAALYAGGFFTTAGGVMASHIARWDGSSWAPVGADVSGTVLALSVFDDGSGSALYVGGHGVGPSGTVCDVARWDGSSYSVLAYSAGHEGEVRVLSVHDSGRGPALLVGGNFDGLRLTYPDTLEDSFLARWGLEPQPVLSCPTFVHVKDLGSPGEIVTFSVSATDCWDLSPTVVCVPPSGSFFPRGRTPVTCTATDSFGNQVSRQFEVIVEVKATRSGPSESPTPR